MRQRIFFYILIIFAILYFPSYWLTFAVGALAVAVNRNFWEILPLFLIGDIIYGVPAVHGEPFVPIFFFTATGFFLVSTLIKKTLLRYDDKKSA